MSEAAVEPLTAKKEIDFFGKPLKLIPEDKVPARIKSRSAEWSKYLQSIPKGKAIALAKEELDVTPSSLYIMIRRLKKSGLAPKNLYATARTVDGKTTVYIVNSTKPTE